MYRAFAPGAGFYRFGADSNNSADVTVPGVTITSHWAAPGSRAVVCLAKFPLTVVPPVNIRTG
jgi:hypothetical protein